MTSEGLPLQNQRLAAWFQYFNDIGLGSFYRDRASSQIRVAAAANTSNAAIPHQQVQMPKLKTNAPPVRPMAAAEAERAARMTVMPVAHGPSLFEASERVEGDTLERIREDIGDCTRCRLCEQRHNIVFGDGNARAELVFVGEGPGHDEDIQGLPFVGRAGKLLTQMIEAMGLRRDAVYICNVVKCRPPENRTPEKDEVATCSPFLLRQLEVIRPKVIVCLGNVAAQNLLGTNKSISAFRGQWFDFRGSRLLATYHPAYLLRNPAAKGEVWNDLKKVMAVLGLKIPRIGPRA
jgi:uracil-DNA glycosylase